MHAKYELSFSYCSKIIVKVKVDNRVTSKPTGQKQYALIILLVGHKNQNIITLVIRKTT